MAKQSFSQKLLSRLDRLDRKSMESCLISLVRESEQHAKNCTRRTDDRCIRVNLVVVLVIFIDELYRFLGVRAGIWCKAPSV